MMQLKNIALSLLVLLLMPVESVFAQADLKAQQENWITLAASMYDRRDFDGAVTLLKSVIEQAPDNDAAYYYMALSSLGKGDADAAEVYLRQAVELDGGNFWYRQRLAALYAATSQPELAIDIYEGLLKDFPKKSDLYIKLVELYAAREDFEKALATLDEIETVFGKSESTAVYRFNFLRGMGRAEEAFKSLEEYNKEYSSPYVLTALADWQISMYNDSTALA